ncbi:50S ribosomal protein L4 [Candidatus Saccharibacteria bacterium]|nr:50S ribosomal protein L4 [Candidatus Saccharibacteria bacterium]
MAVATYTKTGTKATTAAKLDKAVFAVAPVNHELIKEAYVAYMANGRENLAQTKTRGLVRGGGRKPWKQKGTGRARFGSSRNPIWRGGGITFGPTGNENYKHRMHTTAKRQAIKQALSLTTDSGKLIVIEDLKIKDNKTAEAVKLFAKVGATRNVLVIVADKTKELVLATRNIQEVKLVQARYVNVYDVMNADHIVVTDDALSAISDWLGGDK